MRKFTAEQLAEFLQSVDRHLEQPEEVTVIGGGALALAYDDGYRTHDIDTWGRVSRSLSAACEQAKKDTGLPVELSQAGVAQAPYESESRIVQVLPQLQHLTVYVFDPYDVAISKATRGYEKDLNAIAAMHKRHPLDLDTLVQRYLDEMDHLSTLRSIDIDFLNMIDTLYGTSTMKRIKKMLPSRSSY